MKILNADDTELETCLQAAKKERVIVTRNGKPVAIVIGTKGIDLKQLELETDMSFLKMICKRRKEKTISHEELEVRLSEWEKNGV